MKTIIVGIGFVLMMVGASCDIGKSDMWAVVVIVLVGCFFMWIGGKDYEYDAETEAQEEEDRIYCKLDIGGFFSSLVDRIRTFSVEKYRRRTK